MQVNADVCTHMHICIYTYIYILCRYTDILIGCVLHSLPLLKKIKANIYCMQTCQILCEVFTLFQQTQHQSANIFQNVIFKVLICSVKNGM